MTVTDRNTLDERRLHEVDHLPEVPEGVRIPDDLSGLEPPETPGRRVRWMRWMAPLAVVVLAVAAAVVFVATRGSDDGTDTTTSAYTLIQESIDQALAENQN